MTLSDSEGHFSYPISDISQNARMATTRGYCDL